MDILAFSLYMTIGTFTPGPNNCMSMSYAATQGMQRALLFSCGVFFGITIVTGVCGLFSNFITQRLDNAELIMQVIGTVYMIWLAWMIWRSGSVAERKVESGGRLIFNGALLQFVNVKLLLYVIAMFGSFILPVYQGRPLALLGFCLLQGGLAMLSNILWAAGGAALSRAFTNHPRLINGILAILLLFCVVSLWL